MVNINSFDKLNIVSDYSNQAGLTGLNISGGTLDKAFREDVETYELAINGETAIITWKGTLSDQNSFLYVNHILVDETIERKEKVSKGQVLTLKTVAEDENTEKSYVITIV